MFVRLTQMDGVKIILNINFIMLFEERENFTRVFIDEDFFIDVKEMYNQIRKLIILNDVSKN